MSYETERKDEISIKEIILEIGYASKYLKSLLIFIIPTCLLLAGAAYYFESQKSNTYTANTLFLLQTANPSTGIAASLAKDFGIGSSGAVVNNATLMEIISSKKSIYHCLFSNYNNKNNDTDLIINYFIPTLFDIKTPHFKPDFELSKASPEDISRIVAIQNYINTNCIKCIDNDKSSTMSLACTTTSPTISKLMCQNFITYLTKFFLSNVEGQKKQNNVNLINRIDSLQYELTKKEFELGRLRDGNANLVKTIALIKFNQITREISVLNEQLSQYKNTYELLNNNVTKSQDFLQIIDYPEDYSIEIKVSNSKMAAIKLFIFSFIIICIAIVSIRSVYNMYKNKT